MRIASHSFIFQETPPEKAILKLSEIGFEGVELPGFPQKISSKTRRHIRSEVSRLEMEIPSISVGIPMALSDGRLRLDTLDSDKRRRTVDYVKGCIDLASDLNARLTYICTMEPLENFRNIEVIKEETYEAIRVCADYALDHDVLLGIEHNPGSLIGDVKSLIEMIKEVKAKNLHCLVDIGHLNLTKEDLVESVKIAKEYLVHVHLDNNDGIHDSHLPLDEGTLSREDFYDFFKAVESIGYEGYYSLEIKSENVQDPVSALIKNKKYIEEIYQEI